MAELRSTTAIGGKLVWHGGNLRFDPQGETVLYNGYKIYTEHDKPDPHTDLTESVVKRAGDSMSGVLKVNALGEVMRFDGGYSDGQGDNLGGADAWIYLGNKAYAWNLKYRGTSSGADGNEFMIESNQSDRYWSFDHLGNMEYYDGSTHRTMLHTGNQSLLDGRFINVSGDSMTGVFNTLTAPETNEGSRQLRFPSSRPWNFQTRGVGAGAVLYLSSESTDKAFKIEDSSQITALTVGVGANSYVDAERELRERGNRVFSPNNRNITDSVSTTSSTVYASATAAKTANDNANTRVLKSGDTMSGHLLFDVGFGIRRTSEYFLDFNSTDIHMSSIGDITIEADSNDNETTRHLNLIAGLNSLTIDGGAQNSASALKFNSNTVLHTGNYTTNLDGRYVNAAGDSMTGNLTMNENLIYGSSTSRYLKLSGNAELVTPSSVFISADTDTNSTAEYVNIEAGANVLKVKSNAATTHTDDITYNGSVVQHDGRSEMKFEDGAASIVYNSTGESIDFIFS